MNMFEPMKLITVALAILLLAPFGFVFWQIAVYPSRPEAQRKAELEAELQNRARDVGAKHQDGSYVGAVAMMSVESIGFWESTARWLSFYPHRWVGILGLVAITAILVCLLVLLFYPGGLAVSASQWSSPPQQSCGLTGACNLSGTGTSQGAG